MRLALLGTILVLGFCGPARAQWVEQVVDLQRGWNSVFLWVDPADDRIEAHFGSAGIRSIHVQEPSLVPEFPCQPEDTGCAPNTEPGWVSWRPASDTASFANRLSTISPGRVYLIDASRNVRIPIVGKPTAGSAQWRAGWNLAGAFVSATQPPTFAEYFRNSPGHQSSQIFKLDAQANWALAAVATRLSPGIGYWIKASHTSSYSGPIEVDEFTLRGVDFGRRLTEHAITMRTPNGHEESATIAYRPSLPAPADAPTVAGDVPILVKELKEKAGSAEWRWTSLGDAYHVTLGATPQSTRVSFDRTLSLPQALIHRDGSGQSYQGLLQISDGRGFSRLISVAAQMAGDTGLWVGTVTVDNVAWVHADLMGENDATTPRPTAKPFSFRVLIHVDDQGEAKLLSEVMLMWDDQIDDHVLITPSISPAELARLKPTGLQDGQSFTRRISTAAYYVNGEQAANGGVFGNPASPLTFALTIARDDKLNPFRHAFHPDHDEPGDSYKITRNLSFDFDSVTPDGRWTGTYVEAISGLNKVDPEDHTQPPDIIDVVVNVSGDFELSKVSTIGSLN